MKARLSFRDNWLVSFRVWYFLVIAAGLLITSVIFFEYTDRNRFHQEEKVSVINQLGTVRARLEGVINSNLLSVAGLIAELSLNPETTQEEFARYASVILAHETQIRNIAAARDLVITHMYPMKGNEKALGLDYRKNTAQRAAALKARDLGGIILAGPVDLIQGGRGFIARTPVFVVASDHPEIRGRFWGLVSTVIDVDRLYFAAGLLDPGLPIEVTLRGQDSTGADGDVFYGRPELLSDDPVLLDISMPHGSWQIAAVPKGGWTNKAPNALEIRGAGLLVFLLLLGLSIYRQKQLSAKKRIEDALQDSEARFREFAESASDWLWELDAEGRFFWQSDSAGLTDGLTHGKLAGMTREELAGDLMADDDWTSYRHALRHHTDIRKFVYRYRGLEGGIHYALLNGRPLFDEFGKYAGHRGTASDITDRKHFEEELQAAKDDAEQANKSKSEFLASMSHELRTPLNAVLGFAQMLQFDAGNPLTKAQGEHVKSILTGGYHLLELINEVLDLARIEAEKLELNPEDVDAGEIIADCVSMTVPLGAQRQIRIENQFTDSPPCILFTDRLRLKQVLINLLSNAVKFNNDSGSVNVNAAETDDGFLRISVSDTGRGIAREDYKSVFDMFHRLGADPMVAQEGTGIGLTVSRLLIEKMAGRIDFDSEENVGSTFWIEIPLSSSQDLPEG